MIIIFGGLVRILGEGQVRNAKKGGVLQTFDFIAQNSL